jgi:hypothetical protein
VSIVQALTTSLVERGFPLSPFRCRQLRVSATFNDLRIPLVCVGTHEAKQALMTDQQLADRFEAWELPQWQDDPALLQLLASFTAILPLRQASELRDPKIRKRVLVLTEGVMVRICRLLEAAAIQAIETESEHINYCKCSQRI